MQDKFQPSLATPIKLKDLETFCLSSDWRFEQKLDGVRVVIVVENGKATAVGRRNVLSIDPEIMMSVEALNLGHDMVLDGELLNNKLWLFDIPKIGDMLTWETPYNERRAALSVVANKIHTAKVGVLPSVLDIDGKKKLWEWCLQHGTEGIVVKKDDAAYIEGRRSLNWLKAKLVKTVDVFILETRVDGKRNASVGVYAKDGAVVNVGTVTMTDRRLDIAKRGDVLEVRYLYASADNKLVQPHVLKFRDDKTIAECTIDQLQFTNKSIIFEGE